MIAGKSILTVRRMTMGNRVTSQIFDRSHLLNFLRDAVPDKSHHGKVPDNPTTTGWNQLTKYKRGMKEEPMTRALRPTGSNHNRRGDQHAHAAHSHIFWGF